MSALAANPTEAWRRSALLRYAVPLVFERDEAHIGSYVLRLDASLGLEITRSRNVQHDKEEHA